MLALEDRITLLEEALEANQKALPLLKYKLQQAEDKLKKNGDRIESLRRNLIFLKKEAQVVLLSEYNHIRLSLEDCYIMRPDLETEAKKLARQVAAETKVTPELESRLAEAHRVLDTYGQLIPFRRP